VEPVKVFFQLILAKLFAACWAFREIRRERHWCRRSGLLSNRLFIIAMRVVKGNVLFQMLRSHLRVAIWTFFENLREGRHWSGQGMM